jgi:hypothetical protein
MGTLSPLQIALLIVGGLAAIGVIVTYLRTRMTYAGYEEIVPDVRRLRSALGGEVFRDGSDVVISGTWEKNPVVVRFSNQENTPGLNIRMPALASFQLSVTGAGTEVTEGPRTPVKTTDDMFDARFTTRSDQPMQARMLLTRQVSGILQKLACSRNTYVAVAIGSIEHSELVIPSPAAPHVIDHLKSLSALAAALSTMPGADKVKILKIERERHVLARLAMAVGLLVAIGAVVAAIRVPSPAPSGANDSMSSGILPINAAIIPDATGWHAARPADLDSSGVEMLRANGIEPSGRVPGDYSGSGSVQDVAYLLVNAAGQHRVVIIARHQNRYDVRFPTISMVARVPKGTMASIHWKDKPPKNVAGDGLLVVRQPDNPEAGVVVFLTEDGITSVTPANWRDVQLK